MNTLQAFQDGAPLDMLLPQAWKDAIDVASLGKWSALEAALREEYSEQTIYPAFERIFAAFACAPQDVKVVILGQDPYHGPGQANGYCFAVPPGAQLPPSLRNILREIKDDLGAATLPPGNWAALAEQGVLLLNTALTVRARQAASHSALADGAWAEFTDAVIAAVSARSARVVFLLWGAHAKKKAVLIDARKHKLLTAVHPSPLSAHNGFFGCKHFSQANAWLRSVGIEPVDWLQ